MSLLLSFSKYEIDKLLPIVKLIQVEIHPPLGSLLCSTLVQDKIHESNGATKLGQNESRIARTGQKCSKYDLVAVTFWQRFPKPSPEVSSN